MILQLQHVLPGIDKVLKKNKALQLKLSWALVLDPIGGGGGGGVCKNLIPSLSLLSK